MDDSDYESCEMCGNEKIRYVHLMEHADHPVVLRVGCICAGKMTGDYAGAREREKKLINRAKRRANWLKRKWRASSRRGNPFLNVDGKNVGVHKVGIRWGFWIDGQFSIKTYPTADDAKLALFDALW